MNEQAPEPAAGERTLQEVGEAALRLMAGTVSRKQMAVLQRTAQANPAGYPWEAVTQAILAEPTDSQQLVQQGLRAQRDWVLRGGREAPGKSVKTRGKTLLAAILARSLFFLLYTAAVCILLILLKHKWPSFDIYSVLTWLQATFPGFFGGG